MQRLITTMNIEQARGSILVASSPEILTRITKGKVVNRPLAGTRRRGKTDKEDQLMEQELLADEKECAEHVELGQNDMGKVRRFQ
jgi:anthranilate synthase component 1